MSDQEKPIFTIYDPRGTQSLEEVMRSRQWDVVVTANADGLIISALDEDHWSDSDYQRHLHKYRNHLARVRPLNRHAHLKSLVRLEEQRGASPPGLAEFLLTAFAPKRRAEALLGDLEERFTQDCLVLGPKRARLRYWAVSVRALLPLAWQALKKVGVIGLLVGILKNWVNR